MGRALGAIGIVALLALDLALPALPLGRRGSQAEVRLDVATAVGRVGERLPELDLTDLGGRRVRLADLRGHRLVLTFERSLDW